MISKSISAVESARQLSFAPVILPFRLMKTCRCLLIAALLALISSVNADTVLRVGHFPNITHAQGLVAHNLSRQGKGWFEERLGAGTKIEGVVFQARPRAVEAIFAQSIQLHYLGPRPG